MTFHNKDDEEEDLEETTTVATSVGSVKMLKQFDGLPEIETTRLMDRQAEIEQWLERMGPYGGIFCCQIDDFVTGLFKTSQ